MHVVTVLATHMLSVSAHPYESLGATASSRGSKSMAGPTDFRVEQLATAHNAAGGATTSP